MFTEKLLVAMNEYMKAQKEKERAWLEEIQRGQEQLARLPLPPFRS